MEADNTKSEPIDEKCIDILNQLLKLEMAGVVRYTHYSFMIFGFNRIPICKWMRSQAEESLMHAHAIGELITQHDFHPTLEIGSLLETHKHDIRDILQEALEHEQESISAYRQLLNHVEGKSVLLEEFARKMIFEEELHSGEVKKMLKNPGEL